jgi:hypothetical protein
MKFLPIYFSLVVLLIDPGRTPDPKAPCRHPGVRGTLTILFSCAAALALCVWTGIHLNVDPRSDNKREKIVSVSTILGKAV